MGLFIGASILTLLEILDYIYEVRTYRKGRERGAGSRVDSEFRVLEVSEGLALKRLGWGMGNPTERGC